jgi:hypothetical protein
MGSRPRTGREVVLPMGSRPRTGREVVLLMGSRPRTGREVVLRTGFYLDRDFHFDLGAVRRHIS